MKIFALQLHEHVDTGLIRVTRSGPEQFAMGVERRVRDAGQLGIAKIVDV
jgi:hypothetical protein